MPSSHIVEFLSERAKERLRCVRLFLLDMDGTFSVGPHLIPKSDRFLARARETGCGVLFLTNNSSGDASSYAARFAAMGVEVPAADILTSGAATARILAGEGVRRVYLLGTPSLEEEFRRAGLALTATDPEMVVLGFDRTLTYEKLMTGCTLLRRGLPYVATNPDVNCPTPDGPIPDAGSFMAAIEASTGRGPDRVIGKPNPDFLRGAMALRGVSTGETAMVGDRLYTDVASGNAAGVLSILVLSGESERGMVDGSPHRPDVIVSCLGALVSYLD